MLIVALQDDVDNLYAIWDTITDRFLGVNLRKKEAVEIVLKYRENYTYEEALSRVEHSQPFSDIAECITNGNGEGVYVKCPHCGEVRKLVTEEMGKLLHTGKSVVYCDCSCDELYTVELGTYTIFAH